MDCTRAQELISASLDGVGVDRVALDRHMNGCPSCTAWRERAHQLRRAGLSTVADDAWRGSPSLPLPPGFRRNWWLRTGLTSTGILLVVSNAVGVLDPARTDSALHLSRHQSSFGVALGLAFLFVAWRADRAYGMVPFAATFSIAIGATAAVDLVRGDSSLSLESLHFIELAGLIMLWVLGWSMGPRRHTARKRRASDAALPDR